MRAIAGLLDRGAPIGLAHRRHLLVKNLPAGHGGLSEVPDGDGVELLAITQFHHLVRGDRLVVTGPRDFAEQLVCGR